MLLEVVVQSIAHRRLDSTDDLGVAQLGLGLSLELGLEHLDRDDGGEALAEVLGLDFNLGLLEHLVVLGILLQGRTQTAAESRQVGTALDGVDVVDKRVDVLVERGVIGHGDLNGDVALLALDMDDVLDKRLLVAVDIAYKLVKTGLAVVGLGACNAVLVLVAQVGDRQRDTGVQIGQVAQALRQDIKFVDRGREDGAIGVEDDGCAMVLLAAVAHDFHLAGRLAQAVFLHVDLATAAHLGTQVVAQGVHATHAHTVQTARHLVGTLVELTAGMQHGHHDLESRLVQFLVLVDGDTAAVVLDGDAVVLADEYIDAVTETGQCLVDGVVHDLAHQVVQTLDVGVTDVHSRTLAHGFQTLQDLDVGR